MKYYKLTCIKDMPECEKGFNVTVSEEALKENRGYVVYSRDCVEEDKIQVLDKIRAEIERRKKNSGGDPSRDLAFNVCLQIIDKYKAESEDAE